MSDHSDLTRHDGPASSWEQVQVLRPPPPSKGQCTECVGSHNWGSNAHLPKPVSPPRERVLCLHLREPRVGITSFLSAHVPPRTPFHTDSHWAEMVGESPQPPQRRRATSFGTRYNWVSDPAFPLTSCVILAKSLDRSASLFPPMDHGDDAVSHLGLLWGLEISMEVFNTGLAIQR